MVTSDKIETIPLGFSVLGAARASSLSRAVLYRAIGDGSLPAKKCGARTIILRSDLETYLRQLPDKLEVAA